MQLLRYFPAIVAAFVCTFAAPADAQINSDRPGGDYTNVVVRPPDPALCAARCERDSRCKAWTFRFPSAENPAGVCWLKSSVPPRIDATCCVSGVRGAGVIAPRGGPVEYFIDRVGGDFRNFEMPPSVDGLACKAACEADPKCRAWTYQRPGYFGPNARCYLKSQIKPPRRRPFAISGVVR